MSIGYIPVILSQLAFSLPALAVFITGLVLAIVRRKYYPKACTYAIIAFSLLIFEKLASVVTFTMMQYVLLRGSGDYSSYAIINGVVNIFFALVFAGAIGLLIAAIFSDRKPAFSPQQQYPTYYQQPPQAGPG